MRRHNREYQVLSEMNLTNMLDTAFCLLIAFIIASPAIRQGVAIDLPQVESGPLLQNETAKPLTITIQAKTGPNGIEPIYINESEQPVTLGQLREYIIEEMKGKQDSLNVIIEVDKNASYNAFAQVIALLKLLNITNVGLPTEPITSDIEDEAPAAASSSEASEPSDKASKTPNVKLDNRRRGDS